VDKWDERICARMATMNDGSCVDIDFDEMSKAAIDDDDDDDYLLLGLMIGIVMVVVAVVAFCIGFRV